MIRGGVYTASQATVQINDYAARGARAYLNVSAASGTGGLTLQWRGYDRASGNTAIMLLAPVAITGVGIYVYELLDSPTTGNEGNVVHSVSRPLPVDWDINIVAGDASSYTYSLSVETLG